MKDFFTIILDIITENDKQCSCGEIINLCITIGEGP